jgi:EAL domain-containing protein (putative c-di-GMP-specific phosphodiesterase class I)
MDEAFRQLALWRGAGHTVHMSINLSAYQLRQPNIVDAIQQKMLRHQVDPGQVTCEITESAVMEDTRATQRVVEQFLALGIRLSIDDFGTGYSSLAYLRRLRAHELKVDRSFIKDIAVNLDARAVVDAVIRLGKALGMRVVAEGVETQEQRAVLVDLGCEEIQGFLFGRPVDAEELERQGWLSGGRLRAPAGAPELFLPA